MSTPGIVINPPDLLITERFAGEVGVDRLDLSAEEVRFAQTALDRHPLIRG
jgi:hypothetical protein